MRKDEEQLRSLTEVRALWNTWAHLEDALQELKNLDTTIQTHYGALHPQGEPPSDTYLRARQMLADRLLHLTVQQCQISALLSAMPLVEQEILRYRYREARPWEWIANKVGYSISQVHRLEQQAIARSQKTLMTFGRAGRGMTSCVQ
ncbi:MAG: hypothetical protein RR482_02945 [Clostridia bacterium]